jgi:mono/diheme cytochrome c family protein
LNSGNHLRKILAALILALSGCAGPGFRGHGQKVQIDSELAIGSGSTNRMLTTRQMSRALPTVKVTVQDPVYRKTKRYEGFWLEDVLKLAGISLIGENVLIISSLDGYQVRLSRLRIPDAKALLAVRDLDEKTGWEVFTHGKERITPGPFYIVWQATPGAKVPELPWPYQIERLEARDMVESQRRLFPQGTDTQSDVMRGFNVFMQSCVTCHSMNLQGGALGPELNIPKNITEYRDLGYLMEFIKDPDSFRARSKMPAFKDTLSKEAIADVLSYFKWMREHKLPM